MADNVTLPGTSSVVATDDIGGFHFQRVKPTWGVDGSAVDASGTNPFPTSLNASVFRFSALNTTVVQLAAGATFDGVWETALDQPSASILLVSDQPTTLTILQAIDAAGVSAVQPIVYNIPAGQGFSTSVPVNGNYVKVRARNAGTAATTTLSLNTAYGNLPSSDSLGRTPVTQADCVDLLTTTITATGVSSTIDTIGYGAIVTQLGGVWQGNCYFEVSNNQTDWDSVLTFSRDSLSLQDILTSGGMYTVRPSGRYLRLTVTNITGSMTVSAIGRAGEGIAAADLLSLAMDEQNGTPMSVRPRGSAGLPMAQDTMTGAQVFRPQTTNFVGALNGLNQIFEIPCDGALSVIGYFTQTGTSTIAPEVLTPGGWVATNSVYVTSGVVANITSIGSTNTFVIATMGAARIRLRMTAYSSGAYSFALQANQQPPPLGLVSQAGTWTVQPGNTANTTPWLVVPANPTTTANSLSSAATTNATSVKASIGTIYNVTASNVGAAAAFLKIYNKASAPTVGTDVPILTIPIGPSAVATVDFGVLGFRCATGIAFAITNLVADADATAILAAQVKVNLSYI